MYRVLESSEREVPTSRIGRSSKLESPDAQASVMAGDALRYAQVAIFLKELSKGDRRGEDTRRRFGRK